MDTNGDDDKNRYEELRRREIRRIERESLEKVARDALVSRFKAEMEVPHMTAWLCLFNANWNYDLALREAEGVKTWISYKDVCVVS